MTGVPRSASSRADLLQQPEPVEPRHHHVGDDQVDVRVPQDLECRQPVARSPDLAQAAEQPRDPGPHRRVVLDDQDDRSARPGLGMGHLEVGRSLAGQRDVVGQGMGGLEAGRPAGGRVPGPAGHQWERHLEGGPDPHLGGRPWPSRPSPGPPPPRASVRRRCPGCRGRRRCATGGTGRRRWPSSASGMPGPVSATRSTTCSPRLVRTTRTDPSRVNLIALATRLSTTFSHSSGSTSTGPRDGLELGDERRVRRGPRRPRTGWSRSSVICARSVGSGSAARPSASMRATSSRALTIRRSRCALAYITSTSACSMDCSRPLRTSSSGASSRVNGVRNSWLTLDRKAVFAASSAASASRRACSRALAVAIGEDLPELVPDQADEALVVLVVRPQRVRHEHEDRLHLALATHRHSGPRLGSRPVDRALDGPRPGHRMVRGVHDPGEELGVGLPEHHAAGERTGPAPDQAPARVERAALELVVRGAEHLQGSRQGLLVDRPPPGPPPPAG